ncbi:MAG: acyl-CoA thioesterase domain-containing protein, partial [Pseudomonadota bacterium]
MTDAADLLLALLELEPLEENLFRGQSPDTTVQRVFGGQVIGQAPMAAQNTVGEERPCHSLHAYFLLPGDPTIPIVYHVERLRDGGSFTTRRVSAVQHGRPIFNIAASFQRREDGYEHQFDMPEVNAPEDCFSGEDRAVALEAAGMDMDQYRRVLSASPFEFRFSDIPDYHAGESLAPH